MGFFSVDEEKKQEMLDGQRLASAFANQDLNRILRDTQKMDNIAASLGEDQAPEARPNALYRFLDTLDTPRQYIAGTIANLTNLPGYGDSLGSAISKASTEDLTTGDIIRGHGFLSGGSKLENVARGTLGFLGDVITDPVNYVAPVGIAKRIGGLKINEAATLPTPSGAKTALQLFDDLTNVKRNEIKAAKATELLSTPDEIEKFFGTGSAVDDLSASARKAAEEPFKKLRGLLETHNQRAATALDELTGGAGTTDVVEKAQKIASELGVSVSDADVISSLSSIQRRPRFTLTSPFAGSATLESIPLFGARETEVPGLSEVSDLAYQSLKNAYIGTPIKLKRLVEGKLASNPESLLWNSIAATGRKVDSAMGSIQRATGLLSRRVNASGKILGSDARIANIKEHEVAQGVIDYDTAREAQFLFRNVATMPNAEDVFKDMSLTLQRYSDSDQSFAKGIDIIRQKYGEAAADALLQHDARMRDMLEKERFLFGEEAFNKIQEQNARGYVMQMYKAPEGLEDFDNPQAKQIIDSFLTGGPDFTLRRKMKSMVEAKMKGYTPDENILRSYIARAGLHKRILAEKEYLERFAYQWGLPKGTYDQLTQIASDVANPQRNLAADTISQLDLAVNPEQLVKLGAYKLTSMGNPLTPEAYNQIKQSFLAGPDDAYHAFAQVEAKHMQLNFSPEEEALVASSYEKMKALKQTMLGRDGASIYSQAGATMLRDMHSQHLKNLSSDEKVFFDNLLPNSFVRAYEESKRGYGALRGLERTLRAHGDKDVFSSPLRKFLNGYLWHHKIMKEGATVFWPAYWVRNAVAAPFQSIQAVSILGDALNPAKLYRNHRLMNGNGDILTAGGEVITGKQMKAELRQMGITASATSAADFADMSGDMLTLMGRKSLPEGHALSKAWRSARNKMMDWGSIVEAYGREHAYINFRAMGHSPSSAQELTNKLLIDYAHGKTQFERNFLNNIFFFYSFSRGNTSNMLHSLMTSPGALSNQLHAHKAIAEMLTDPRSYENRPDMEEKLQTYRSAQELTTYIGNNPETDLPMILKGTPMPVEDLGKWMSALPDLPRKASWVDILNSVGDSVGRTASTLFSQMNPATRGIFERLIFKRDLYFNRPITDDTLRKIPMWKRDSDIIAGYNINALPDAVWNGLDKVTKEVLNGKPNADGTWTIDPHAMTVIQSFVPWVSRFLSTRNALSDPSSSSAKKFFRWTTGLDTQTIDPEKSIAYEEHKRKKTFYESRGVPVTKAKAEARSRAQDDN